MDEHELLWVPEAIAGDLLGTWSVSTKMRLAIAVTVVFAVVWPLRADEPWVLLPLSLHVAPQAEPLGADWLETVNALFADAKVRFVLDEERALPDELSVLRDNRARHRLKRHLRRRRINVFVVHEIRDPWPSAATRRAAGRVGREPSGRLGGAHILAAGHRPGSYVIVLDRSMPLVVAHELGHVLGAAHHADPTNIMSYGRHRDHFDAAQLATFRRHARRMLRRRDVRR